MRLRRSLIGAALGLSLVLTACGGDDDAFEGGAEETAGGNGSGNDEGGSLVVGGANFTEMLIMQEIYRALLEDAGFTVEVRSVDAREIYAPALADGQIDVVPEYAATMAEYLNREANGPDAEPVASSDIDETMDALRPLAEEAGLVALEPAQAVDQNAFAVTQEFAEANSLASLSDLGALGQPVVLAATEECPDRPFCQPGLEETYGIQVAGLEPLGFGTLQVKQAVADGDADLGLVASTDGTLEQFGLVVLEDDQGLQNADNLVPVVNAETAEDQAVVDALNSLADVLTTEDLATLNAQVDEERQQPADVATAYLEDQGLIGG
ncbi:MAG TPA: ABC transporter substrate-binding protein [Jiangellales bacterium]|nr:ABC transporter substrate-binding protein [Jiangellales bacterium]